MIDALATEPQFLDHLAPIWSSLPGSGRLLVDGTLLHRAAGLGLQAEAIDSDSIRATPLPHPVIADGPTALVASYGDIKVGRRLGYRRFAFVEHGIGQSYAGEQRAALARHGSYSGGIDREDVGLFLVPNEHAAGRWREFYPGARVEVVGSPRLDSIPHRVPDGRKTVAISFHWPSHVSPEADSAIGYYGAVLSHFAEKFHVIGHAHPKGDWPERMRRIYRRAGIPFVADFDDVCRQADVYVCDNSSTIYEFASTGRPVVVLNSPRYRKSVNHGLRFWEAATVGVQVNDPANLVDLVTLALTDPPKYRAAREAALDVVYAYRTGAAERAVAAVLRWLGWTTRVIPTDPVLEREIVLSGARPESSVDWLPPA